MLCDVFHHHRSGMYKSVIVAAIAGSAAAFAPSAGLPGSVRRAPGWCLRNSQRRNRKSDGFLSSTRFETRAWAGWEQFEAGAGVAANTLGARGPCRYSWSLHTAGLHRGSCRPHELGTPMLTLQTRALTCARAFEATRAAVPQRGVRLRSAAHANYPLSWVVG